MAPQVSAPSCPKAATLRSSEVAEYTEQIATAIRAYDERSQVSRAGAKD
jgi:hypothetical protein